MPRLPRPHLFPVLVSLAPCLLAGPVVDDGGSSSAGLEPSRLSKFFDPEDGWFDLSSFLDNPAGFIPLVIPITEEAVGYGFAAVPVFISENAPAPDGTPVRPNIGALGGFTTDNGSEGVFGGHSGTWLEGRLQTTLGGLGASVNLDFYGLGNRKRQYNLETTAILANVRYRLGDSPFMAGLGFVYADMEVSFDSPLPIPEDGQFKSTSQLAGPMPSLSYDSRDNIFTPTRGTYAELSATLHDPFFGASTSHQRIDLVAMHFWQLRENLTLGLRGDLNASFGDTPFYALPFVTLRGVPAMRYQGETTASTETELRWQFWKRFSLVAFGGVGVAETDSGVLEGSQSVFTGGGGFRYEVARRYNLHMGVDLGFSNEGDSAIYITFGSAWGRL